MGLGLERKLLMRVGDWLPLNPSPLGTSPPSPPPYNRKEESMGLRMVWEGLDELEEGLEEGGMMSGGISGLCLVPPEK